MYSCIIYFLLLVQFSDIVGEKRRGETCTTPNNEQATCKAVKDCKVILDAIITENSTAIKFAQESLCGYDTSPLVCCGANGYPSTSKTMTTTPSYFKLFKKPESAQFSPSDNQVIFQDLTTNILSNLTVCGLEKEEPRIYGGTITALDEFSWMAALEYKSKSTGKNAGIKCGGSLINNRYVLTAAHCLIHIKYELISVWLGEWNITGDPDCVYSECSSVLKSNIEKRIFHPFYSPKTKNNDIGLARLEKGVKYTDYIRPICLPSIHLPIPTTGTQFTVAGWGATENGLLSDVKLKVNLPLLDTEECYKKLFRTEEITSNVLCAGGKLGKDACQGDSGGPIMKLYRDFKTSQSHWYQEGVVSWGLGCTHVDYISVYTRVARYIKWISNTISEDT